MNRIIRVKDLLMVVLIMVLLIIFTVLIISSNTNSYEVEQENSNINNTMALMVETNINTDVYEQSVSSDWPGDEYEYNEELSYCENGSAMTWDEDTNSITVSTDIADKCWVYFDEIPTLAKHIINTYTEDGENSLYYFDGEGTYTNVSYEAEDLSYRYSGASDSTYNYVCFGSDDETCPDENLYRIIGVFLNDDGKYEVKLMKAEYCTSSQCGTDGEYYGTYTAAISAGSFATKFYIGTQGFNNFASYYFNYNNYSSSNTYNNDWNISELNTINLNTDYINYLGNEWSSMITEHTWIIGGNTTARLSTSSNALSAYTYEIDDYDTTQISSTYDSKIGLIYVSDYYYAASPTYWSYVGFDSSSTTSSTVKDYRQSVDDNWMFLGAIDWTITRTTSNTTMIFFVNSDGYLLVYSTCTVNGRAFGVRPTFYLNSNVRYASGDGSSSNPYRLLISE